MKKRFRTRDLLIGSFLASGPIGFFILAAALVHGSLLHQHVLREFIKPAKVAAPNALSVCEFEGAADRGLSGVPLPPFQRDMVPVVLMSNRDVFLGHTMVSRSEVFKPDCTRAMPSQLTRLSAQVISHSILEVMSS